MSKVNAPMNPVYEIKTENDERFCIEDTNGDHKISSADRFTFTGLVKNETKKGVVSYRHETQLIDIEAFNAQFVTKFKMAGGVNLHGTSFSELEDFTHLFESTLSFVKLMSSYTNHFSYFYRDGISSNIIDLFAHLNSIHSNLEQDSKLLSSGKKLVYDAFSRSIIDAFASYANLDSPDYESIVDLDLLLYSLSEDDQNLSEENRQILKNSLEKNYPVIKLAYSAYHTKHGSQIHMDISKSLNRALNQWISPSEPLDSINEINTEIQFICKNHERIINHSDLSEAQKAADSKEMWSQAYNTYKKFAETKVILLSTDIITPQMFSTHDFLNLIHTTLKDLGKKALIDENIIQADFDKLKNTLNDNTTTSTLQVGQEDQFAHCGQNI